MTPTRAAMNPAVLGMSEAALQANILDAAKALRWLRYHTHISRKSQPGFPDLVLVHERQQRLIFAELKTEKGPVTPEQVEWLHQLRTTGRCEVYIWRPRHWAAGTIQQLLQPPPRRAL
jgi:hypothetical protein